jgi:N-acetylglucosamine kinase-like BadF-type ATPase
MFKLIFSLRRDGAHDNFRSVKIFLGIDGGGTGCRAVLVDETGAVLGVGSAGSSHYHNVGIKSATNQLQCATHAALRQARLSKDSIEVAFLGLSGIKGSTDIVRMTAAVKSAGLAPAGTITVANDLWNALAGGLEGAPGIALIAGTGGNCLGQDASGKSFMCGGWGWLLDDLGAGFGIGTAGLRAAVRAADKRGDSTRLLDAALAFLGVSDPDALSERIYGGNCSPSSVAAFAPVVSRLASEGDARALAILEGGAEALAELISTTASNLAFSRPPDIVLLGGCICSGGPYRPLVERAVQRACPQGRLRAPMHGPLYGAALNALRLLGRGPLPAIRFPESVSP